GAKFCPNCGSPVTASLGTEERKMVTVLFADLVDSTGLAQRLDPERAREVLGQFYDAATEELVALRGQPEKFIGDAVMAVFGLPQVTEEDAVRAVRAGLAIRDRTGRLGRQLGLPKRLQVRVGIESGEAATGVGPAEQLLVTGPVVNAAARIQAAAAPGEVLAGETTHQLTLTSVSFGDERRVEAKGFESDLAAFPVDGLTTRSVRRTIPIVGRMPELTLMRDSLARAIATGRPHLFSLVGEPGIGKSRLVEEFVAGLADEIVVLAGRGTVYGDSATFAPVASMVREIAGIDENDPSDKSMRRLRDLADAYAPAEETERTAERLALALGLETVRRDESSFVQEVQHGFISLVEGLETSRTVVVVFDDAHRQRGQLLDLVERLAARGRIGPDGHSGGSMVIAAGRTELLDERPAWGSAAVNHLLLRLEPLSVPDATELVRQASGGSIMERNARSIAERTGGNPFFIVETTGMLLRSDTQKTRRTTPLPPTVQQVVAARLDSLPVPLRDFARRVAVFLHTIGAEDLAYVGETRLDSLQELEDEEILVRVQGGSRPRWRFRNETLREVAYASLPKRERLRLHLAIADGLVADRHPTYAAEHLERAALASLDLNPADRSVADRASEALARAGDRAQRRMENRTALDYYERSLALAGPDDAWGEGEARVLAGMGEARYWLSEYPAAIDALDRAIELGERIGDIWTLATGLRFRGDIAMNIEGDIDRAQEMFDRALELAEQLGEPRTISRTLLFAGWVPWMRDDFDAAEAMWKRALALADENDDDWARVRALTSLSISRADQEDYEEARSLIEAAAAVANDMGDQFSVAVTTVQRGRIFQYTGHVEDAIPHFDRAIAIFSELGARWELADAMAERGICHRELGNLDQAESDLQAAIRISEELGERQLASWTWRALARVSQKRGNPAEEEERLRRAEEEEARRPQ
ncbi:MAG TPA: tetratricopeptide repeat protein, partial [Actinomycetota bacterium]|nr:tetratricopeptide repeat protein [Actinomycetota bacterium]